MKGRMEVLLVVIILVFGIRVVSAQDMPDHVPPQYEGTPDCLMQSPEGTVGWEDSNVLNCSDLGTYENIRYNLQNGQIHDIQVVDDNLYGQKQENKNGKSDLIWGCGWFAAHQGHILSQEAAIQAAYECYWMFSGAEQPGITEYLIRDNGTVEVIPPDGGDDDSDDDGDDDTHICDSGPSIEPHINSDGYLDDVWVWCAQGYTVTVVFYMSDGDTLATIPHQLSGIVASFANRTGDDVGVEVTGVHATRGTFRFSWGARG